MITPLTLMVTCPVMVDTLLTVAGGLSIGVSAAIITVRLVANVLFGISPSNPAVIVIVSGAVVLTSLVGCILPVRKALNSDLVAVLRADSSG